MNISKFLLIDATLLIAAIPLLFLIQGGKKKYHLLRTSKKEELLGKTSIKLPEKEELIELEKIAKFTGSGIEFDSLLGHWKFLSVWKKETNKKDSFFSSLLRIFSAKLLLQKEMSSENQLEFSVTASIKYGIVSIEFLGNGYLKGKQPFLPFWLNIIELKIDSNILFSRTLGESIEKEKSYFELIALEENGKWLSARGQGGDLILWMKD